jgi:hypothetical protein
MCKKVIPPERKSDAITCSKECTKKRKDFLRSKQDAKECRYCNKPSTPEDRVLFGRWKKAMKKGGTDEQFVAQVIETTRLVHENERLKRRLAELEPVERVEATSDAL